MQRRTPEPDLPALMQALAPDAPRAERHLWLLALLHWIRSGMAPGDGAQGAVSRVRLLLDAAEQRPQWREEWSRWRQVFQASVDLAPLFADYGFAPHSAFLSGVSERLRRQWLPGTPDTDSSTELFDLIFKAEDAQWLRALDAPTLARVRALLFAPSPEERERNQREADADKFRSGQHLLDSLLDALMVCVGQISATGLSSEIRLRMSASESGDERAFHALPGLFERFRARVLRDGPTSPEARAAEVALREQLDACRRAASTVYLHLDEYGISTTIVFGLRQLRGRVLRARALLDAVTTHSPAQSGAQLLARLALAGAESRSLRVLVASSTQLTAAKVAERQAETGEHYITRNRAEYRAMLAKAGGGGLVLGLTTWAKLAIGALGIGAFSPFWLGLAYGLNYAFWFVLIMLLHWTVATKQPAMTAPAMAAKLKHMEDGGGLDAFVGEVAHLLRSQTAAIAGNVGVVVPTVLLICGILTALGAQPMASADKAHHIIHDHALMGPTPLFAAFTGVLLFASSVIAGWVENAFVYHRLDSALAYNPRITHWLGRERAARWALWWRANVSGLAANVSLGLLLGLVPPLLQFVGIGLEVRHVTLSSGQLAAAAYAIGPEVLRDSAFWMAVAGVLVVGPLNLAISFFLAFRLALLARGVTGVDRSRVYAALRQRWIGAPLFFLFPPPDRPVRPGVS